MKIITHLIDKLLYPEYHNRDKSEDRQKMLDWMD